MGLIEEMLTNGVSAGVQDAIEKIMAGNATSETVDSLNTILTTTLPWSSPINNFSWAIFYTFSLLLIIYYAVIWVIKPEVKDQLYEKYLSLENKSGSAPGAIIVILGDKLYILTNIIVIVCTMAMLRSIMIESIFVSSYTLLALGLYGLSMLALLALFSVFMIIAFFIYAVYLISGLAVIRTLGLVLFFNPNSETANRLLRLFWANQLYPLALVMMIRFVQLVDEVFSFPILMLPAAMIFVAIFACILLYVIHTLAWDNSLNRSISRYRGNITWTLRKTGLAAALGTGNPAVIAAATAASASPSNDSSDDDIQIGIKTR